MPFGSARFAALAARFAYAAAVAATAVLGVCPAFADGIDMSGFAAIDGRMAGTSSLAWLKLPVGARNVALGGQSLTTDDNALAQVSNPAAVALAEHPDYAMAHAEVMGEFRLENLSLAMPWRFGGNLGITVGALFTGAFENARDIDEEPTSPTASEILAGVTYGRKFFDGKLMVGARADVLRSAIEDVSGYAGALSLGSLIALGEQWRAALTLKNFGPGVYYSTPAPMQTMPMSMGFEIGKPLDLDYWSAQAGLIHEVGGLLTYYAGGEMIWKDMLLFRLGYAGGSQDHELGPTAGLSGGMGILWDAITIDYGFKHMGYLGGYHAVGLSYAKRLMSRRNDDYLLSEARASYAQGDYHRALKLTQRALGYNPKNYKAQAFLSIILADLERLDERAVSILFTANTRGSLAPMWIAGKPLGGLARRAAKLKELRQSYPHHVLIDAGDLLSATTRDETRGFIASAYALLDYDAIGVGPQEMARGEELLGKNLPFVASQKPGSERGGGIEAARQKKLPYGGRIRMLSVMLGSGAAKGSAEQAPESAEAALLREIEGIDSLDLVIVSAHGTLQQAYLLAQKIPRIDVIVLSGESGALQVPMQAGKTYLVCPGVDGAFLGQLTFVFDKQGKRRSMNHRLIPLDIKVPEDEAMDKLLGAAIVDLNKSLLGDGELELTAKVLPVLDDSLPGQGRLQLADLVTGALYPIITGGMSVTQPAVAWGRNLIAFVSPNDTAAEVYAVTPGRPEIDTLTRQGGRADQLVFGLRGKAVFAIYAQGERRDLVRIDPWRHEMIDLTQGRMGAVQAFALSPQQDRIVFASRLGDSDIVTLAGSDLSAPLEIARVPRVIGRMVWSPDGERFAFLKGKSGEISGEIYLYDTRVRGLDTLTGGSSVYEMAFSSDSRSLYFSGGLNVTDLNRVQLDSMSLSKVTSGGSLPRQERYPVVRYFDNRETVFFIAEDADGRHLMAVDPVTRQEREVVPPRFNLRLR